MASLNIPNSFSNNTVADATQVNANFTTVKNFAESALVQVDGSVKATTASIADDAVTSAKIAPGAVGTSEIADDAVTSAKISNSAVGTTEIADDAVTADKVANGATLPVDITGNAATASTATYATSSGSATNAVNLNNGAGASTSWSGGALYIYANPINAMYPLIANNGFYEPAPVTGSASTTYYVWRSSDGKLVTRSGTSLRDHKTNIEDVENGLEKIKALRPRTFKFKEEHVDMEDPQSIHDLIEQTQVGFVVEEVLEVSDDLITYDYNSDKQLAPKMWKENAIISLAVKAIQELSAKVDALQEELNSLKNV